MWSFTGRAIEGIVEWSNLSSSRHSLVVLLVVRKVTDPPRGRERTPCRAASRAPRYSLLSRRLVSISSSRPNRPARHDKCTARVCSPLAFPRSAHRATLHHVCVAHSLSHAPHTELPYTRCLACRDFFVRTTCEPVEQPSLSWDNRF